MTYYLDPFGCVKNQVDAENMMALLNSEGWDAADNAETADLIIINSCGFIESAKQESINAVLNWRKIYPGKKILLAGCLAQRYGDELSTSLPEADGLFGIDNISGIVEAAEKIMPTGAHAQIPRKTKITALQPGKRPLLSLPGSAYVKISEGCDNRCSYCAIPVIRGGLKSRDIQDILRECKTLLERGIKELCIVGQDIGAFGADFSGGGRDEKINLPELLKAISSLEGHFWVRLLYIHPDHFPLQILDLMEKDTRFLPYFDLPFQHSSQKILAAMNRKGTAMQYLELIETIRRRLPDAVIRSTFMTGFPGETGEDFALLLDFQKKAALDWLGCFAYSREEDTPSYDMKGRVAKKSAAQRKRLVEDQQVSITERQMDRFVGRVFEALVEERFEAPSATSTDRETEGPVEETIIHLGRLPCQAPEVDGSAVILGQSPLEPGSLISCKVISRAGFDLVLRPL
jgi:ribosomal protein S12 methylthiotransferase